MKSLRVKEDKGEINIDGTIKEKWKSSAIFYMLKWLKDISFSFEHNFLLRDIVNLSFLSHYPRPFSKQFGYFLGIFHKLSTPQNLLNILWILFYSFCVGKLKPRVKWFDSNQAHSKRHRFNNFTLISFFDSARLWHFNAVATNKVKDIKAKKKIQTFLRCSVNAFDMRWECYMNEVMKSSYHKSQEIKCQAHKTQTWRRKTHKHIKWRCIKIMKNLAPMSLVSYLLAPPHYRVLL